MVSWKFYTYVHRRADSGDVFYVGKGQGRRSASKQGRSDYWRRVVGKHGLIIEAVAFFIKEEDAFDHERLLIAEFRSLGVKLANLTDGGEGTSGRPHTPEAIAKMVTASTGKIPSQQARERMSAAAKGKVMSDEHRKNLSIAGRARFSDPDEIKKASDAQKGKGPSHETAKKIQQTRIANGNRFGWVHSQETKIKMSKTRTGKPINRPSKKIKVINADV